MKNALAILLLIGGLFWLMRKRANELQNDQATPKQNDLGYQPGTGETTNGFSMQTYQDWSEIFIRNVAPGMRWVPGGSAGFLESTDPDTGEVDFRADANTPTLGPYRFGEWLNRMLGNPL